MSKELIFTGCICSVLGEEFPIQMKPKVCTGLKDVKTQCFVVFAFQGMNDGLVAPTMVDLELVTGGTPESVSVMFSLRALFIVLGSVVSGKIIQKRPSKRPLLIGIALLLESLFGIIIPWLPTTGMVDLASGISALFTGAIIVGK